MSPTTIHARPTGVPDQATPGIETRDLARLFRRSPALAGVSVRVEAGRAVAVLGANGAGKTTLLRILATALRPSFGSAAVDGIDVAERPEEIRPLRIPGTESRSRVAIARGPARRGGVGAGSHPARRLP